LGFRHSVAPNSLAALNLSVLISTAIILLAFAILAPSITESPTAPRPKTATVAPS